MFEFLFLMLKYQIKSEHKNKYYKCILKNSVLKKEENGRSIESNENNEKELN